MANTVCYLLVYFLALLGCYEIYAFVAHWIYKAHKKTASTKKIVIPLIGHREDIEYLVRGVITKFRITHPYDMPSIVCVDLAADSETKKICEILSRKYTYLKIFSVF